MYGNIVLKPGGGGWNPENPQPYDTSVILGLRMLSSDGRNGTMVADYEAGMLRIGCDGGDARVWVTVVNRLAGMVYRECVDCTAGVDGYRRVRLAVGFLHADYRGERGAVVERRFPCGVSGERSDYRRETGLGLGNSLVESTCF